MATKKKPVGHESIPGEPTPRHPVPEDSLGDRIKQAREARQWTQVVLATRTRMADPNGEGVSRTVLVGYESGKYKPGARELRLLADALHVTPNWLLYGSEKPFVASLPSLEFLQGENEVEKALRIALALLVIKQHERDLIASLLFSLAGRELGDLRLGGLMTMARMMSEETVGELVKKLGTNSIEKAIEMMAGAESNWGTTLQWDEHGDEIVSGEPIYKNPKNKS